MTLPASLRGLFFPRHLSPGNVTGRPTTIVAVSANAWNTAVLVFALVLTWAVLGAICWWFWKHRHDP